MKKIIYLLSFLLSSQFLSAQNLVAYYKLDGNANAFYGSPDGNTSGIVQADTNRFNMLSSCIKFTSSSYASIPNSFDYAEKTINFWIKLDTVIGSTANILTIDNGNLNHGMIYLQVYRSLGVNKLQFFGGNASALELNVNSKQWYKISITYKNSVYKLYINNILKGTRTSTNVHSVDGYPGMVLGANRALGVNNLLQGNIDDLSIYNYEMDSAQLANLSDVTCNLTNIITTYDTLTIVDTNYVTITDTNYVTFNDTLTIIDTNIINFYDTTFVSVNDTLIISVFSSVNPNSLINTIKVYPNPVTEFILIDNGNFQNMLGYKYEISSGNGQLLHNSTVNSTLTSIDASNWPPGIYFLNIYDNFNSLIEVKKIIIQ